MADGSEWLLHPQRCGDWRYVSVLTIRYPLSAIRFLWSIIRAPSFQKTPILSLVGTDSIPEVHDASGHAAPVPVFHEGALAGLSHRAAGQG
jgi:hypothetical protein